MLNYNKKHFIKVKESAVHKDKMHGNIVDDDVRDKILSGELNREDCNEENAYKFLSLLKRKSATQVDNMKELTDVEFRTVVQQSQRRSTSSIFSKRDYSVHKCAMHCERMVKVLVRFYNTMIKHNHFPSRWLNVLDVMIEKGKGNKVNKLRVT